MLGGSDDCGDGEDDESEGTVANDSPPILFSVNLEL